MSSSVPLRAVPIGVRRADDDDGVRHGCLLSSVSKVRRSSFPVSVLGQFGAEDDGVRGLGGAEAVPDEGAELVASTAAPPGCRAHDDGDDALAPLLVGHPDHRGLGDRRVLEQDVLDLGGGDVLAAADDRVVGAALDEQVALVVEPAAVAGGEPAVGVERRRRPRTRRRPGRRARRSARSRRRQAARRPRRGSRTRLPAAGGPPTPSRARTAGSSRRRAARWSSGPSTATVEAVSVSP